ncbi:MAG: hypothetical protein ACLTMK_04140 [Christensenellaceae bacterium]
MYKYANIIFHDSTHGKYRRPLGAVAPGQEVTLSLYIKDVYVDNAFLRVFHNSGSAEYRMEYSDGWWSTRVIMPEEPGLVCIIFYRHRAGQSFLRQLKQTSFRTGQHIFFKSCELSNNRA